MNTNKRDNLKFLRLSKSWTQHDLAKRVGTSQQTICAWEQGIRSPTLKKAKKLAEIFEVPIENFL